MIDTKALRSRILDLAIQGKLTEQLPSDGTAKELYQQIQAEKQKLIKEKPLPSIKSEEILFEIPDNWKWVRFGEISNIIGTGLIRSGKEQYKSAEYYYFKMQNIENFTGKCTYDDMVMIDASPEEFEKYKLEEGDFLFNTRNSAELVGKTAVVHNLPTENTVFNNNILKINFFGNNIPDYINLFFISSVGRKMRYQFVSSTTNVAAIYQRQIVTLTLPLPPLAEQKRIVERVEEIFRLLDTIDQAQEKYSADSQILKAKLITTGIQGKLTKQLPSDGSAQELYQQIQAEKQKLIKEGKLKKEKPLPEISADEIPFEIPNNWMWVRLGAISNSIWAGRDKPDDFSPEKDETRTVPVVANGVANDGILGYTSASTAPANTITVAGRGTIGFSVYRDYEYCPIVRLVVIEQSQQIEPRYLQYYLSLVPATSVGSSIPQLTVPMIRPKIIPLPPLAEQKRITDVLERVLGVLE